MNAVPVRLTQQVRDRLLTRRAVWLAGVAVVVVLAGYAVAGIPGAGVGAALTVAGLVGWFGKQRWPGLTGTIIATAVLAPLMLTAATQQSAMLSPDVPTAPVAFAPLLVWLIIAGVWSHFIGAAHPWRIQLASALIAAYGGWAFMVLVGPFGLIAGYVTAAGVLAGYPAVQRFRHRRADTGPAVPAPGTLSAQDTRTVTALASLPDAWSIHGPITTEDGCGSDGVILTGPAGVFAVASRALSGTLTVTAGEWTAGTRPLGVDAAAASALAGRLRRSLPRRDASIAVTAVLIVHDVDLPGGHAVVDLRDDTDTSYGRVWVYTVAAFCADLSALPAAWSAMELASSRATARSLTSQIGTGVQHLPVDNLHAWDVTEDGALARDLTSVTWLTDPHVDPVTHPVRAGAHVMVLTDEGSLPGVAATGTYIADDGQMVVDIAPRGSQPAQTVTVPAGSVRPV